MAANTTASLIPSTARAADTCPCFSRAMIIARCKKGGISNAFTYPEFPAAGGSRSTCRQSSENKNLPTAFWAQSAHYGKHNKNKTKKPRCYGGHAYVWTPLTYAQSRACGVELNAA